MQLAFSFSLQWIPSLPRQNDTFLMEHFRKNGNHTKDMMALNRCRLYLKVLTLSDIASANRRYILPEVKLGQPLTHRTSTLSWPDQDPPIKADWNLWAYHLAFLETRGRLTVPLGDWISPSHLIWHYHAEPDSGIVTYRAHDVSRSYHPVLQPRQQSLDSGKIYDFNRPCPPPLLSYPQDTCLVTFRLMYMATPYSKLRAALTKSFLYQSTLKPRSRLPSPT